MYLFLICLNYMGITIVIVCVYMETHKCWIEYIIEL